MSDRFAPGNQHVRVRSDTTELQFQANDGSQNFLHDNTFIFGVVEQTAPKPLKLAQNHELFSNYNPFLSYETPGGNPMETGHLWGMPGIPSSLPTSLPPSIGSDTYDASTSEFQNTDQSTLDPSSILVGGRGQTSYYNSVWNPDYHSTVPQVPQINDDMTFITTRPSQAAVGSHIPTIGQKRKRSTGDSTDEDDDAKPSSRRSVKYLFRWLKHPSVPDLQKIAKDNRRSFEFVVGCFLEQNGQRKPNSGSCNATASTSQSISWQEDGGRSVDDDSQNLETEILSVTGVGIRQKKSTKNSDSDAWKATGERTKAKTHRCSDCSRAFLRPADLTRHMKNHLPSDIQCQYRGCGRVFRRKDKLNEHWKKYHKDLQMTIKPKNPRQRDEGPDEDPDFGGPRNPPDQLGASERNKPPSSSQKGSSSVRSRCTGQKHLSHINYGLASEAETPYFISNNKSDIKDMRDLASTKIIRKLGRGGFGSVYEVSVSCGIDTKARRNYACKTIPIPRRRRCEVIDRAQNEISILQVLDHPNIIKLACAFILDNHIFINTFPVADCNLKEFLNNQSFPLSSQVKGQLWEGAKDLAFALAYLHDYGTGGGVHGDIKPENILVIHDIEDGSRARFLLADFGSAKLKPTASMANLGKQALTPKYCAPEWFKNEGERGPPSDIWSFGCILMQIVTYIHDKTMIDFEAFRVSNSEIRNDWTYQEILPVVNSWLRLLPLCCANFERPVAWKKQIDIIAEMLLPNPEERPSSVDVISKMGAEISEIPLEGDGISNDVSISTLQWSQWEPIEGEVVADSLFAYPESTLPDDSQRWPTYEPTR